LHAAASDAFTAGMSGVLLACAAVVALAALGCARHLPALTTSGVR
jgi:hypothetical protein